MKTKNDNRVQREVENDRVILKVQGDQEIHTIELSERFLVEALAAIYEKKLQEK